MKPETYDYAVIGGGIVGLAHAWMASRMGARVAVFEQHHKAQSASIANFGMIWPIGQPVGKLRTLALRSRDLWLEGGTAAGFAPRECGSVHVAHHDDEWEVLQEFQQEQSAAGYETQLLSASEVMQKSPAVNPDGLRGGLWSPYEVGVDPRVAVAGLTRWLHESQGVDFFMNTSIKEAADGVVTAADNRAWNANEILICSGVDFAKLFPEIHARSGLKRCKLQMFSTVPQPSGWKLGAHLASGLTLRHYSAFSSCPSLSNVNARVSAESPELDRFGIHVMMSQGDMGRIILGDSHEYGPLELPYDQTEVDELILRELKKVYRIPSWEIKWRWNGVYAKHPEKHAIIEKPAPRTTVVNGFGGAGMTLSMGVAEQVINGFLEVKKTSPVKNGAQYVFQK